MGGFFLLNLNAAEKKKTLDEDTFLFLIKDQVFSVKDLQDYQKALKDFSCIYPDSYIVDYFTLLTKKFDQRVFQIEYLKQNFKTNKVKSYQNEILKYLKMAIYTQSQSVSVTNDLVSALSLSAKTKKCSLQFFKKQYLEKPLFYALSLEVFFRSRNVIDSQNKDKATRSSALQSLDSLANSIVNQISHSQFEVVSD
jgi:hypothetical protein